MNAILMCDTDHYLVVAKVRERLTVNKKRSLRFHMERFNFKKLNEVEGKEQYHVEVTNRFAVLEDLDAEVEIKSAWETIKENIKILAKESLGYFESKKHKPWFDEECSKLLAQRNESKKHKPWFDEECSELLAQRNHAKFQWLRDPSEINGDNLNNVIYEASRYLRNKKKEYLKDKINDLARNNKNKNIRDLYRRINEFKRSYQPRNNLVKDENGDLLADSLGIFNRWKNYCSQLLNVHNVSNVSQIEVHNS
jgi:hypothetical protein